MVDMISPLYVALSAQSDGRQPDAGYLLNEVSQLRADPTAKSDQAVSERRPMCAPAKVAVFPTSEVSLPTTCSRTAGPPFMMRAPEDQRRILLGRRVHGKSGDLSGDLRSVSCPDVFLVHLTPTERPELPTSTPARSSTACRRSASIPSLMREMRAVAVRDPDDRRGQADRRQTNVHPPDRGRRNHQGFGGHPAK